MLDTIREWGLKTLLAIFAILSPIKAAMIAVFFLVAVDFITGCWASMTKGHRILSFKMRRSVVKFLAYETTVIFAYVIDKYMIQEDLLVKLVCTLIALTEGKSFFENMTLITGIDFWNAILTRVQGKPIDTKSFIEKDEKK